MGVSLEERVGELERRLAEMEHRIEGGAPPEVRRALLAFYGYFQRILAESAKASMDQILADYANR